MYMETLPTEILMQIFLCSQTVSSAVNLSATCRRFREIFRSSKRLLILSRSAEAEFGPTDDIVQLVTQNLSQPAYAHRSAPLSEALLHQLVKVGRVAQKWEDIYPTRKWKDAFADRRVLTHHERYVLRRAIYRLWLFDRAYHTSLHARTSRLLPALMHERAALLHNFNAVELAEMLDMHLVLRDVVANNICPSNGKMRAKFNKRFQNMVPSHVSVHLNYSHRWADAAARGSKYHASMDSSLFPDVSLDGWGDDIMHYYVVEDMMKLDPGQILYLREQRLSKMEVEAYVNNLGEWFGNNGEVFSETLGFVVRQRGVDMEELKDAVRDGEVGIIADA